MLLFRSEENIEAWCQQQQMPLGQILSLEQVWQLSQQWYPDRLSPDFAGRSQKQVEVIFQKAGLFSSFWDLSPAVGSNS
ncbi:MAG: hypothetical protein H6657_25700 [Ardenticatenaceae bacterium]|nr:hypothetical protein [Ardenticatenaceae bacterium]